MGVLGTNVNYFVGVNAVRLLPANETRVGILLLADAANAGNIFLGFADPAVTIAGDKQGIQLAAADQYAENPPQCFTGEVWAIADVAAQVLRVIENVTPAGQAIP